MNKLEAKRKEHALQVSNEVLAAVEFELIGSLAHAGAVLTGFSVKFGDSDVLMILRAILAGRQQVCFVGAPDLPNCFRKAVQEAYSDSLRWREDEYARDDV